MAIERPRLQVTWPQLQLPLTTKAQSTHTCLLTCLSFLLASRRFWAACRSQCRILRLCEVSCSLTLACPRGHRLPAPPSPTTVTLSLRT